MLVTDPCPGSFIKVGKLCLHFTGTEKTWDDSRQYCLALGAKLLEINEMNDFADVIDYIKLSK